MNPYVYSRSKKKAKAATQASAGALFKSVFSASINPVVAFAFVLFAAGSVASMSVLAYPEISQAAMPPLPQAVAYRNNAEVLGASTTAPVQAIIQDTQLEAAAISGKISAKALTYNSTLGRWDYTITYTISSGFSGTGTLSVGSYPIAQGITTSGSATTGSILKPSKLYNVTLWLSDQSGNPVSAIRYQFKTAKATTSSTAPQGLCAQPQTLTASSTVLATPNFCIKKDDGSTQCAPITCMPPMRLPWMGKNFNSSSTLPIIWSTSTPPGMRPNGMPPVVASASGTPPRFPFPNSASSTAGNLPPPPTPRQ